MIEKPEQKVLKSLSIHPDVCIYIFMVAIESVIHPIPNKNIGIRDVADVLPSTKIGPLDLTTTNGEVWIFLKTSMLATKSTSFYNSTVRASIMKVVMHFFFQSFIIVLQQLTGAVIALY